jgi:hypothetical protein
MGPDGKKECFVLQESHPQKTAVHERRTVPRHSLESIQHASRTSYRDASGNGFQNRATDFSNTLHEEMPIHVFYDSLDSRESAVLEGSLY